MSKHSRHLTENDARLAHYIDFEGVEDGSPVLLGVLRRHVQQYVVDKAFEQAGPEYVELRRAVAAIVARAEKQDRRIVSWNDEGLDVVRALKAEPNLVRAFEARHTDGLALAARWATRADRLVEPGIKDVDHYLGLIGLAVPSAGPGSAGATIRRLRPTLEAGRPLTLDQAQAWQELRARNRYDCEGMRALCIRAAGDLDRQGRKARSARKGRKKRRVAKPKT